ncbi:hypothetical protein F4859DRAFT_518044 [Xylaria cf. heliscus]|nr:hypothetical protein F4859DRAFT_518044 [Xylaria cf. heliscus]
MFSTKFWALACLIANPILAGTPQGYGYGDVTDTVVGASTDSPVYTETPYSILPVTITNSVTLTKPITVTVTHTITVSRPACSLEITTISGTTSTTLTTRISIFIPGGPSSKPTTTQKTTAPSVSGEEISTTTISTPTLSITGFVASGTTTSCESSTATADVNGVTSSTTMSSSTLFMGPNLETSSVRSGAPNGTASIVVTRTSSSAAPLSTIATSIAVQGMVDGRLLVAAVSLASLLVTLAV